ncbi:gamma-glutamyl-gamma-aminobutyrate hydrolase family protein [Metabacillus sp. GX 13764]|uniref:gamma-glutamyl-gamma-aminobutyrate hydrolase family protein n=1 Tax=Metabacillus kandeliae TaxID=2900151 RepID=UPI001E5A9968|nr:gamma-glutamyl-gamma-aminobutyrate hydrolase family protein [Metabacillus kandeliae]MCD7034387.1 gamma-glutamyl-gamma-aminobutyrate hydrolase family protein [Metabacillus kandeliae]
MHGKPVIGITCSNVLYNKLPSIHLNLRYIEAVEAAGGVAAVIPSGSPEAARDWMEICDGLLLSGGEDIDPGFYGEEKHELTGTTCIERDEMEMALIHRAKEKKLPVFAICRGAQMLNTAFGGTLIQDIGEMCRNPLQHKQTVRRPEASHSVRLEDGSRLSRILGKTEIDVNSLHHQTFGKLAEGIRIAGKAPDGITEVLECTEPDWPLLAVQWHPEEMSAEDAGMRKLFEAFIVDARAFKSKKHMGN